MKKTRRLLAFLALLVMLFSQAMPALASGNLQQEELISISNLTAIYNSVIPQTAGEKTAVGIKSIQDFAGNSYILVEYSPTGYMIYHAATGNVVEGSAESESPYLGKTDNLYYGGPTFYYEKIGNTLYHTYMDETADISTINASSCSQWVQNLYENQKPQNKQMALGIMPANEPILPTDTYIYGYSLIRNLHTEDQMGYYAQGNGACGYIAAGIILLYHDYYDNDSIIDNSTYLSSTGRAFTGPAFSQRLRSLGSVDGTTAMQIRTTIILYGNSIGVSLDAQDALLPTYQWFINRVDNDQPSIMFGYINGIGAHAVVVYGYTSMDNFMFIAHYGHGNRYSVYLNALFGSGLYMTGY